MEISSVKYSKEELATVALGCILHDLGKPIQRAAKDPSIKNHQRFGFDFINDLAQEKHINLNNFEWQSILKSIRYHHAKEGPSNAEDTYIPWIAYEADNLASAHDRYTADFLYDEQFNRLDECDEKAKSKWDSNRRLQSIFTYFNKAEKNKSFFDLWLKRDKENGLNPYPYPQESIQTNTSEQYQRLESKIRLLCESIIRDFKIDTALLNKVSQHLEELFQYVPPDTYAGHTNDVSLYEHLKLTSAIGSCMYAYISETHPEWISEYTTNPSFKSPWSNLSKSFREEKSYVLFKADISGIQDFIYNISSKQALKGLRGRSFYLELLCQQISDEILNLFKLGRVNQIYLGGGGFSLLLPNIPAIKQSLDLIENNLNSWLLKIHDGKLSINFGYIELTGNEIKMRADETLPSSHPLNQAWQSISAMISNKKLSKFQKQLQQIFEYNHRTFDECNFCHKETNHFQTTEDDKKICDECFCLKEYGEWLSKTINYHFEFQNDPKGLFPSINNDLSIDSLKLVKSNPNQKNTFVIGDHDEHHFSKIHWSTTVAKINHNEVLDFTGLAKQSCGVERIGVLRADIDNLGKVFKSEALGDGSQDHYGFNPKYKSLSRDTSLSRNLARFFTVYLDDILSKDSNLANSITVVYAGGDDLFLVGAWDKVIDAAITINDNFRKYCLNTLTISAGISIHGARFPLYRMAEASGQAEKVAKRNNKNSLTVFFDEGIFKAKNPSHTFTWDKWKTIKKHINLIESFKLSTGYLYQILIHLRESLDKDQYYSYPRLIYSTARMEELNSNLKDNQEWKTFINGLFDCFEKQEKTFDNLRELETALNYLLLLRRGENDELPI